MRLFHTIKARFAPPFKTLGSALSTLLNGLISYWPLDEVSGTRYDSVGSNDLTDNNTVGQKNRGPLGTYANIIRVNSEYLSHIDDPTLRVGVADFTWAFWYNPRDVVNCGVIDKGTQVDYTIDHSGGNLRFYTSNGGAYPLVSTTIPDINEWHFIIAWRDGTGQNLYLQVDGGTPIAQATGAIVSSDTAGDLKIGNITTPLDGLMSNVGFWKRILTAGERTSLYAKGNGKTYSELTAAEKVDLVSYWNLDEVSGTRYDAHGSNDLTDNNTVGSINTGPKQVVAEFVAANNESLSHVDDPSLNPSLITISVWVKANTLPDPAGIIYKWDGAANELSYRLIYYLGNWSWWTSVDGNTPVETVAISLPDTGEWHQIIVQHSGTRSYIGVDGVIENNNVNAGNLFNNTKDFCIGSKNGASEFWDGEIAGVGVWSRVLTAGEITSLFNLGKGLRYEDLPAGLLTDLVSYWDLDELSGTRYDAHGANDLTDNNTVTSLINVEDAFDGGSAFFVQANTEYLTHSEIVVGQDGNGMTFAAWFKLDISGAFPTVVNADAGASGKSSFGAYFNGTTIYGRFTDSLNTQFDTVGQTITLGKWHLVIGWLDPIAQRGYISVDNATPDQTALMGSGILHSYTTFGLGWWTYVQWWGGNISEVALWSRPLTALERTELFKHGAGKYYPFP